MLNSEGLSEDMLGREEVKVQKEKAYMQINLVKWPTVKIPSILKVLGLEDFACRS